LIAILSCLLNIYTFFSIVFALDVFSTTFAVSIIETNLKLVSIFVSMFVSISIIKRVVSSFNFSSNFDFSSLIFTCLDQLLS